MELCTDGTGLLERRKYFQDYPDTRSDNATHDPKALEVAQGVHQQEKAIATILFGSRATGTQDELLSDINILVITGRSAANADWSSNSARAGNLAARIYNRPVDVHLVPITLEEVDDTRHLADSVAGIALRDGIIAGGDQEQFRSVYNEQDPPPPQYHFGNYNWFMQIAKIALEMAVTYHTGTPPKAGYNPMTAIAKGLTERPDITSEKRYDLVRHSAAEAIGYALDAAFWATGKASPNRISLEQKAILVAEALPQESLTTRLPLATYQETETPLALSREYFIETAVADTRIYREAAKRARRRTGSQSKKALRKWEQARSTRTAESG